MKTKSERTKDALLQHGRRLYWTRGFSNVSLREISGAAGVDVALVSRYFGSKRGLFEATMCEIATLDPDQIPDVDALIELVVELFATAERTPDRPSPTALILMNASDPEIGPDVRAVYQKNWQEPMDKIIGDKAMAAQFSAALLGFSVAEKVLHLDGIADYRSEAYKNQLRTVLRSSLADK